MMFMWKHSCALTAQKSFHAFVRADNLRFATWGVQCSFLGCISDSKRGFFQAVNLFLLLKLHFRTRPFWWVHRGPNCPLSLPLFFRKSRKRKRAPCQSQLTLTGRDNFVGAGLGSPVHVVNFHR